MSQQHGMIKATAFAKVVRRVSVHPTTRAAEVERLRDVNLEVERLRRAQWEQDSAAWQAASSAITAGETTSAQGRLGGESGGRWSEAGAARTTCQTSC